jgi:hypothetical protein
MQRGKNFHTLVPLKERTRPPVHLELGNELCGNGEALLPPPHRLCLVAEQNVSSTYCRSRVKTKNFFSTFSNKLSLKSFFCIFTKTIHNNIRQLRKFAKKIKKMFNYKKAKLSTACETKGIFLWKYFDDMFFCEKYCENICFPESFLKNLCNTRAICEASWKHLLILQKIKCFCKIFATTEKAGSFLQDIFFESLNILINTFWWFLRSSKIFSIPYTIINFIYLLWNCFLKPSSDFPSLLLVNIFYCQPLIDCREN